MPDKDKEKKQGTNISRRNFLKGVGTGTVAATVAPSVLIGSEKAAEAQTEEAVASATIQLNINGKPYQVEVEARTTLLTVLRDGIDTSGTNIDLTGAKLICDRGECGGCTVMIDGKNCLRLYDVSDGRTGQTDNNRRRFSRRRRPAPRPRSICTARCTDVRVLHTRFRRLIRSTLERKHKTDTRRHQSRSVRKYVPLWHLSVHL